MEPTSENYGSSGILCDNVHSSDSGQRIEEAIKTVQDCFLPKLPLPFEEMTENEWLIVKQENLTNEFRKLEDLIENGTFTKKNPLDRKLIVQLLALLGEHLPIHANVSSPWSNACLSDISAKILRQLFRKFDTDSFNSFVTADLESCMNNPRKTVAFEVIKLLRQKVAVDSWKYFPAATSSVVWIILTLKCPVLSDFIGETLSPSLLLIDDYNDTYKLLGLRCVEHIVQNTHKADFLREQWAMVLLTALEGLLHDKNEEILKRTGPLILYCLSVVEVDPHINAAKFTKYDASMQKLLTALELCTQIELKGTYVEHIMSMCSVMKHATCHWRRRICRNLLDLTNSLDTSVWHLILECLQIIINNTWVKPASGVVSEIILRLLFNVSVLEIPSLSSDGRDILVTKCKRTLSLLSYWSDFPTVRDEIRSMRTNQKFHKDFVQMLLSIDLENLELT